MIPCVSVVLVATVWLSAVARPFGVGPIRPIESPAPPGSGEPRLTAGPGQSVAMSWLERRASGAHALLWALRQKGRWSKPTTIAEGDSFFVNGADTPSLRWLGGDRWVAHWLWGPGGESEAYDVRMSFSDDGGRTWRRPIVPHRDGTRTEHGFVSLVREPSGIRAIWLDGRDFAGRGNREDAGPTMALRTALVAEDGSLRDELELDGRTCDCCPTAAVSTPHGTVVAYRDRSRDEVRDIALVRNDGKGWSAPRPLHVDGWQIAGCPVNGPALDARGARVAIAWFTSAADTARVLVARSDDEGRHFQSPARVDAGNPLGRVGVALLPDGTSVAIWIEGGASGARGPSHMGGNETRILARTVSPSSIVGPVVTVARTSGVRGSGIPQIALSESDLYFAWTEAGHLSRIRVAHAAIHPHGR